MHIGVFDSGVGGRAVAVKLQELLPDTKIISVDDHDRVPYGDRAPEDIIMLTKDAIAPLLELGCGIIVIACNTATTIALSTLRETYPAINFIGVEPMIKPAAKVTKTGIVAVLATPRTLQSNRYSELKQTWAKDITVLEPNCSDWAKLIESGNADEIDVELVVKSLVEQNVDVIVLGCTHYHLIKQRVLDVARRNITVSEPTNAIASRIKSMLS
jgi:glutamate racemase